jgi:hypothetical protein
VRQLQTNPGVRLQTGTIVSSLLFLSLLRPEFLLQYLPARFGSSHLTVDDQFVELQTADRKQWDAWCCGHSASRSSKNTSWASFTRGSDLATGGVCVLELVKMNPDVFDVSIFHLADYRLSSELNMSTTYKITCLNSGSGDVVSRLVFFMYLFIFLEMLILEVFRIINVLDDGSF